MSRLVAGKTPNDYHTLDGRDVHCGSGLDLLLPGGVWMPVRYETTYDTFKRQKVPVLYFGVGGEWENWQPPAGIREGQEYEIPCDCCKGRKCVRKDDPCYSCSGKGTNVGLVIGKPDKETTCKNCEGTGKVPENGHCWECWRSQEIGSTGKRWTTADRPGAPQLRIMGEGLERAELRWRVRG